MRTFFVSVLLIFSSLVQAQVIKGKIIDGTDYKNLAGISVQLKSKNTLKVFSNNNGEFIFKDVPKGIYTLTIQDNNYFEYSTAVEVKNTDVIVPDVVLESINSSSEKSGDMLPTVATSTDDGGSVSDNVASVLTASRDVFQNTTSFALSPFRYNFRGYQRDDNVLLLNGASMNSLEQGEANFSDFGGLNDVFRYGRQNSLGLEANNYAFGDIGNNSYFDGTAGHQRKGTRISYALSNRSYTHRLMATHHSGWKKSGWAYSVSGSRRFASEGYVPGTFYDSWSYYASVSKKLGSKNVLSLSAFGVPTTRGRARQETKEAYQLYGTNFYNEYWGFQNGKKRNPYTTKNNLPTAILTLESNPNNKTSIIVAAAAQMGERARGSIDWYNAANPSPAYYRNMPSFFEEPSISAEVANKWINGGYEVSQLNFNSFYDANMNGWDSVQNANGSGNTVYGRWSKYIIKEDVEKVKDVSLNAIFNRQVDNHLQLSGGVGGKIEITENFARVKDLMGGDFIVNVNQFTERNFPSDPVIAQNNADIPNQIVREGDKYSYHYKSNIKNANAWIQLDYTYSKVDFFISGKLSYTQMYREGLYANGLFTGTESKGKSDVVIFKNGGAKAGITYKVNGRNYIYLNALYENKPRYFSEVFINERTRNLKAKDITGVDILSAEVGYILKNPLYKLKINGFYTTYSNDVMTMRYYNESTNAFGTGYTRGIQRMHTGVELGADFKIYKGLSFITAGSYGYYIYTNRPTTYFTYDNDTKTTPDETVYLKNFRVATGPQAAGSAGFNFRSKNFWFLSTSVNVAGYNYVSLNLDRRKTSATEGIDPSSTQFQNINNQEKLPTIYTWDASFSRSFLLNKTYKSLKNRCYIDVNAGVSNILDNRNNIIGGSEQLRFDSRERNPDKYANRYTYMLGRTYFIGITFKM